MILLAPVLMYIDYDRWNLYIQTGAITTPFGNWLLGPLNVDP
jgi:hypothetical protein